MGILGSAFGRALSGAAGAAGAMANRYIDEELTQQRAQALADIQRRNAQGMREDADAFDNDPKRVERNREKARQDALATGRTTREVELEGLNDPALAAARTAKGDREAKDATRRKVEEIDTLTPAEVRRIETMTPAEVKRIQQLTPAEAARAGAIADAQGRSQAKYREPREPKETIAAKVSQVEAVLGRPLTEQEKLAVMGMAKNRDPELDTETVTEEQLQPDGSVKKTTRKQVRRPGQAGPAEPTDDPIKAAMDAARAAKDKKPAPQPAAGAPAASNPAPAGGGLMDKARKVISSVSDEGRQTGAEYQAIERRVREAGRGGPPLTQQEVQTARKWRLPV